LTMAMSCVPTIYAVGDVPAVQAEEESVTKLEFTEGANIEVPHKGTAMFADDDGTVYYRSWDSNNRIKIFTLDENGKIKYSFNVECYVNDSGVKVEPINYSLKQCGEYLYFMYNEATNSSRENVIVKLDKELNEISKNKFAKGRCLDTNGEKIVYLKGETKIYICDMDGKNDKLLYTTNKNNSDGNIEQPLNSVAIAGNYVGFQKRTGYSNDPNRKAYCGMINIETGKVTLKEQRSVQQVFSSGDNLIWYGDDGYYPEDNNTSFTFSSDAVANDTYYSSRYKYYDTSEIYVFDGNGYSVLETPNKHETGYGAIIDNEGNLITESFDMKGHVTYRIYRDSKLLGEYTVSYKGYSCFTANNGIITISYTGRDATAADWVAYDPETTTTEELQAKLDKTPAAKDTVKSVTISYK
ncbi:MAG: hypothetical protein K2J76_05050, partial [Oscillospiraceae bacterium]|nr:hypothetical protein [Oscillospiraceae bacterium]